jgi:hypothetical protein
MMSREIWGLGIEEGFEFCKSDVRSSFVATCSLGRPLVD